MQFLIYHYFSFKNWLRDHRGQGIFEQVITLKNEVYSITRIQFAFLKPDKITYFQVEEVIYLWKDRNYSGGDKRNILTEALRKNQRNEGCQVLISALENQSAGKEFF